MDRNLIIDEEIKLLDTVAVFLASPKNRVKNWHNAAEDKEGNSCDYFDRHAIRFCICGAIRHFGEHNLDAASKLIIDLPKEDFFAPWSTKRIRDMFATLREKLLKERE